MIIRGTDNEVLSNVSNSSTFKIQASAKAFQILSSALYERKIEAIIRELSCNAYDSHVSAGHPEKPFRVHLPDSWEPEFYVEDFGVGLSDKEIEEIYTSYFTSTKTDSNELIGGLGLGSKTPFAYTDTFTVRSRKDGIEYTYNAYIGETGEPTISLMAKHETEEPNGVKVSLPVNSNDFYQFRSDAQKIYSWFRVKPELNIDIEPTVSGSVVEVIDDKGYYIQTAQAWDNDFVVAVMGNVAYRVNGVTRQFGEQLDKGEKAFLGNNGIYVKFNIGDLDVAASRETISFDPETTKVFLNRIRECISDFTSSTQNRIDQCETFIDAFPLIKEDIGMWALGAFEFNGVPIDELSVQDMLERILEAEKYAGVDQLHVRMAKKDSKRYRSSTRYFELTDYWGSSGQFKQFMQGLKGFVFVENCEKSTTTILRRCAEDYEDHYVVTMDGPIAPKLKSALKEEFGKHAKFLDGKEILNTIKEERRAERERRKAEKVAQVGSNGQAESAQSTRVSKTEIRVKDIYYADDQTEDVIEAGIVDPSTLPEKYLMGYYSGEQLHIEGTFIASYVSPAEYHLMCKVLNVDAIVVSDKRSYERNLKVVEDSYTPLKDVSDESKWGKQYVAAVWLGDCYQGVNTFFKGYINRMIEKEDPITYDILQTADRIRVKDVSINDVSRFVTPYRDRTFYGNMLTIMRDRIYEAQEKFFERYPLLKAFRYGGNMAYPEAIMEYIELIDNKPLQVEQESVSYSKVA